jgi:acyl carrier protein
MPAPEQEIYNQLQDIFELVLPGAPPLSASTSARQVRGWDSIAQIQIIVEIEKRFQIRFNLGEVETARNIGELVQLIEQHLENAEVRK